jgi:hypothetical protein
MPKPYLQNHTDVQRDAIVECAQLLLDKCKSGEIASFIAICYERDPDGYPFVIPGVKTWASSNAVMEWTIKAMPTLLDISKTMKDQDNASASKRQA